MFDLTCTNKIQLSYIDQSNMIETDLYITQSVYDSTQLDYKCGSAVCGIRKHDVRGAKFYIFGGAVLDLTTGTILSYTQDLKELDVTMSGGVPVVCSITDITANDLVYPPKRIFSKLSSVGSFIYLYGGFDENNNILADCQRFSLLDNKQNEIQPTGDVILSILNRG